MKVKYISRDSYHGLEVGKSYELVSVQYGMLNGDYYVQVRKENEKTVSGHHWRFDLPLDKVKELVK